MSLRTPKLISLSDSSSFSLGAHFTELGAKQSKICKIKNKEAYPNHVIQKQLYNDVENIFQELAAQEVNDDAR